MKLNFDEIYNQGLNSLDDYETSYTHVNHMNNHKVKKMKQNYYNI